MGEVGGSVDLLIHEGMGTVIEAICLLNANDSFMVGNDTTPCSTCKTFRRYLDSQSTMFTNREALANCIIAAYVIISALGGTGNLLVMFAMARCPTLRNVRNYFILNLAISDFLMCTLTAPFTLYTVLNNFWPFGDVACGLMAAAQGISIIVSSLSLTGIGLDRYILIIFPTRAHGNQNIIVAYMFCVWLVSFTICLPYFIATATVGIDALLPDILDYFAPCGEPIVRMCVPQHWEKLPFGKTDYTISIMLIQYLFPLCTLFLIYCHIGRRIAKRGRANFASSNRNQASCRAAAPAGGRRGSLQQARQRRTLWLLTALVINFAALWLPLNIYNVLIDFELADWDMTRFSCCHLFGMLTACANPVLYGLLNENFRVEYLQMITSVRQFVRKHCLCLCYLLKRSPKPTDATVTGNGLSNTRTTRLPIPKALKKQLSAKKPEQADLELNGHVHNVNLLQSPDSANKVVISTAKHGDKTYNETTVLLAPESSSAAARQSSCEDQADDRLDAANNVTVSESILDDDQHHEHNHHEHDLCEIASSAGTDNNELSISLDKLGMEEEWEPRFIDDEDEMKSNEVLTPDSVPLVSSGEMSRDAILSARDNTKYQSVCELLNDTQYINYDNEPAYV